MAFRSRFVSFGFRFIRTAKYRTGRFRRQERRGPEEERREHASGNFLELERTNQKVRGSKILPAGVPGGLVRMRHRLAGLLHETPLPFVGVVVAIAVLFRAGIGMVRPAAPDTEAARSTSDALHEPPRAATATTATGPAPIGAPGIATPTPAPESHVTGGKVPRTRPEPPRKKPRTHGRR